MSTIHIKVPTEINLHIKNACILPYTRLIPLRSTPDDRINKVQKWAKTNKHIKVMELHLPASQPWALNRERAKLLLNPNVKAALSFIGGNKFNMVTGHPNGTEIWVIDDIVYRAMTWRSVTMGYWNKKDHDSKIIIHDDDSSMVHFLCPCQKLNEPKLKELIVDTVGLELLKRDKPKAECPV